MNRDAVADALDKLKVLQFPSAPDDPDIADWIMELLEVDGYHAGLATTVVGGGRIDSPGSGDLDQLREWLGALRAATPADEVVLAHCHAYFSALERVHLRLRP